MKFKCRKCNYFGNEVTCPLCGGYCKIKFKDELEKQAALYMMQSFLDDLETAHWSEDYEPVVKEMEERKMLTIKKKKEVRYAFKCDNPIWREIVVVDLLRKV